MAKASSATRQNLSESGEEREFQAATLGELFRHTRESRGIPMAQAAHETRIRSARLEDLEKDEHSHMSPAYARLFVRDYARYLRLKEEEIRRYLPEPGAFGVEGYDYIRNANGPGPHVPVRRLPRKTRRKALLAVAGLVLMGVLAVQGVLVWKKMEAIRAGAASEGDSLPEVVIHATPVPVTSDIPQEIRNFRAVGEEPAEAARPDESAPGQRPAPLPQSTDLHAADWNYIDGLAERGPGNP